MYFEVIGDIRAPETIARGSSIRELSRLHQAYGRGKWRKCKGYADVNLPDGATRHVELHWYEAHGKGRFELKIKRYVE